MATLAVMPTLYELEEGLQALLDTEECVPEEQMDAFWQDLQAQLAAVADKRDRVAHFLAWLDDQQEFAAREIKRLQSLKSHYETVEERVEDRVVRTIESLGKDAKGKYQRLEGHTTMMYAQRCPASVEVIDGVPIPLDYQRATVTLPASVWQEVLNLMPELLTTTCKLDADKTAIKAALLSGEEVPGAKLIEDKLSLRRK